jgi:hypothetical protein
VPQSKRLGSFFSAIEFLKSVDQGVADERRGVKFYRKPGAV